MLKKFLPIIYILFAAGIIAVWFLRSSKGHISKQEVAEAKSEIIEKKKEKLSANFEKVFLAGRDLYDLETGKPLFENWFSGTGSAPGRIFYLTRTKRIVAQYGRNFGLFSLDGKQEQVLPASAVSDDLTHGFFPKDGDIWLGKIDWQKGIYTDERKITSVGYFKDQYFVDNVLLGTDKKLLVRQPQKLLLVDVDSGRVQESDLPLEDLASRASPDRSQVIGLVRGRKGGGYVFSLETGEASPVEMPERIGISQYVWLSPEHCLLVVIGKGILSYKKGASQVEVLLETPVRQITSVSPDGKYAIAVAGPHTRPEIGLINIQTKSIEKLPGDLEGIFWTDPTHFFFSRITLDSELRGTWVRNVDGVEKRLAPAPYVEKGRVIGRPVVLLKDAAMFQVNGDEVWMASRDGETATFFTKAKGDLVPVEGVDL
jgi:hypothetical protein